MLGQRKSSIQVVNKAVKDRLDKIKKVDIDIFKSGVEKLESYEYFANITSSNSNLLSIAACDKKTSMIRFKIDLASLNINSKNCSNVEIILDDNYKITPQVVADDDTGESDHYEFTIKLSDYDISHNLKCSLDVEKETTQFTQKLNATFQLAKVRKDIKSQISLPVDSYRDALLNVTKLWLLSGRYDRVRHPNWAGFFDDRLRRYPMNEQGANKIKTDLAEAIKSKIEGIYIDEIEAVPDPVSKSWKVSLASTDLTTQISSNETGASKKAIEVTIGIDQENVVSKN